MRQVILDTETTGLSAQAGDRIIEIGCVELISRKRTDSRLHFYLNPDRSSHPEALAVHGITDEFLQDKPRFAEIADELVEFLRGAELVIHNAAFDLGFLERELALAQKPPLKSLVSGCIDTLQMAKDMFPGKRNSLDALCDRLGVDNSGRTLHGALLDAELLLDVYINLTRGQEALLMEGSTNTSHAAQAHPEHDLSAFDLPLIVANEAEVAAHAQVLAQISKANGGQVLWPASEPS